MFSPLAPENDGAAMAGQHNRRCKCTLCLPTRQTFSFPDRRQQVGMQFATAAAGAKTHRHVVQSVLPDSPAQRLGVQPGWILDSVNGEPAAPHAPEELASRLQKPTGPLFLKFRPDLDTAGAAFFDLACSPEGPSTEEQYKEQRRCGDGGISLLEEGTLGRPPARRTLNCERPVHDG